MEKAGVPGLSCAILNDSQVAYVETFGVKNSKTGEPLDPDTVFTGASFSKTVFAYVAMQLVEEGVLDLDRPLHEYLARPLPSYEQYVDLEGDDRYRLITARMCLSHSTGFPNWRWFNDDGRLQFNFEPGERHAYSGEGIVLLQRVIEELTGKGLEELARERVFVPLGMSRTGFVWQDAWADNLASPHDRFERPRRFNRRHEADAAGSIATTPGDYAKLLVAVLSAEGERGATVDQMLKMQVVNRHAAMFGPRYWEESDAFGFAGWGLGWGRFDCGELGRAIFHTGHDSGAQNYTVTFVDRGIGVVLMSNSDNFEGIARELSEAMIGDTCSPFDWMAYPRFDPTQSREAPPEPVEIDVEPVVLERYAGNYRMSDGRTLSVQLDDGRLVVSFDALDWTPLLAETSTRFFMENEDERFTFVAGDTGEVTHMEIGIEGQTIRLERIEE
jgi:CubicO group peptidase (beta-lactamase class C family)